MADSPERVNGVPIPEGVETYPIQEQTGNPADPSVDEVIDLALENGEEPRRDHPNGHLDEGIAEAIDRFGEEAVAECIRLTLGAYTNRVAGSQAFGEENYVWGIHVSVAAHDYLSELRRD